MSSQENDMYSIHFDCKNGAATWWFTKEECHPTNDHRWCVSITEKDLDDLINNLQGFKAFIKNFRNNNE